MKRPVAFAALCLAVFLAMLFTAGQWGMLAVTAASFLIAVILLFFGRKDIRTALTRCALLAVCMLCALLSFEIFTSRQEKTLDAVTARGSALEVVITSKTAYPSAVLYKGNVLTSNGMPVKNITARFFSEGTYDPGDGVVLRGAAAVYSSSSGGNTDLNCEAIPKAEAKTGVSEGMKSEKTGDVLTVPFETPTGPSYTLIGRTMRFKYSCREAITGWLGGQEGALCVSLITGDRTLLSDDTLLSFERVGISHILAVSGLHVSVLIGLLSGILKKMRVKGLVMLPVMGAVAFFISLFYGFTPSVIRACTMAVIGFAAGGIERRNDPLTTMSVAALAVLIPSPSAVVSPSFLLSFGCCFALVAVNPAITERLKCGELAKKLLSPFILTLSVNTVMLPLLMLFGMNVSTVAVIAGPAVVLLTSWLLPLLPVFILVSVLPLRLLPGLAAIVCGILAKGIIKIAEFFSGWGMASLALDNIYLRAGLGLAIILIIVIIAVKASKPVLFSALSLAVCLSVSFAIYSAVIKDNPVLTVYDNNTLIVTRNRQSSVLFLKPTSKRSKYAASWLDAHFNYSPCYVIIPESGEYGIQNVSEMVYYTNSIISSGKETVFPFTGIDFFIKEFNGDINLSYNDISIVLNYDETLDIPGGTASMVIISDEDGYRVVAKGQIKTFGEYDKASWLLKDGELRRIG